MLPKVLLFSALVIGAAAYPLFFGPVDFSISRMGPPAATSSDLGPATIARVETSAPSGTVALKSDSQGHFFGEFKLNGRKTHAMVDTGATLIAINTSTARRVGIALRSSDFTGQVGTANGVVAAAPITLDTVQIGRIKVENVRAVVIDDRALPGALIGMSFLKQLKGVEVRGSEMVLEE
jgi:aspartyl protease family protein